MKIAYIDGPRLGRALIAGSQTLIKNSSDLDAINVFPVADGDTGTNMAGTVRSMMASLAGRMPSGAGHVLKTAARSALEGARGNSGAILAQFFGCLASEIGTEARINAKKFAAAAVAAAEHTRKALSSPREGTILTVLHEWAAALEERARHSDDILHIFMGALDSAKASLARTRDMLPEMKRAGVVDAGAKGFVHLLEGIADFMTSGRLERRRAVPSPAVDTGELEDVSASSHVLLQAETIPEGGARFCTEAMLHGSGIDQARIRETLGSMGESIVVAGSDDMAKIHIHTNAPDKVFDYLESQGELSGHKVDDMELQTKLATRGRRRCAIVVDTGCDLPEGFLLEEGIIKVPALLTLDGKSRIDGPGLSLASIHGKMENDPGFSMSTSQPSDGGFVRAFSIALANAEEVLYIGLSSGLSGTFEAGSRAARKYEGKIVCVDSKSVTAGSGILVAAAAEFARRGMGAGDIASAIEGWRRESIFLVSVKDLTSLQRSGRISGMKGLVLRKFGIRPILTVNGEGKAHTAGLVFGENNGCRKIFSMIKAGLPAGTKAKVHIVHVKAEEEAKKLAAAISDYLSCPAGPCVSEMGPLLASIAWLGSVAVAILPIKP